MTKLLLAMSTILAGALVLGAVAIADSGRGGGGFRAQLNGYQEVPSKSTIAKGRFQARVVDGNIHYTLSYSNLETNALFAHIHFAQRHTNGGISAFLCGGGGKPACPPTSGTVSDVIRPADVIGPGPPVPPSTTPDQGIEPGSMAELIRAMRAGATYANVHTTRFGGGEIRGQIRSGNRGRKNDDD